MRTWPPSTNGRVVLVGQRPVDLLGQPRGHGDRDRAAGPQHAGQLGDRGRRRRGCARAPRTAMTRSKVSSANGRRVASPLTRAGAARPSSTSPASAIAAKVAAHLLQLGVGVVEGDDAAPRRAASKAWRPNPQPRSSSRSPGRRPELGRSRTVSISGRPCVRCACDVGTASSRTSRYCSTVRSAQCAPSSSAR